MAKFPALPLFVDAYWVDAGHLSDAEHGRYLMMLMQMWIAPDCRFPNDDQWLARKFRRTVEDVQRDLRPIIAEFMQTDGNWITQKRLQKEWAWCQNKRYQNSASAKSRWKQDNPFSERSANAYANAMPPTLPKKDKKSLLPYSLTTSERAPSVDNSAGGSLATAPLDSALASPPITVPDDQAKPIHQLTAAEIIDARRKKAAANGSKFYASADSAQLLAWEQFTGSVSRDTDGGCWFPTEWPPTIRSAMAAI